MRKWITSKNRKRHQRAMNAAIREMNRIIWDDDLWKGRFYARQAGAQWYTYEDGSGAELWVVLQFIDRVTGKTQEMAETVNHWLFGSRLFWSMNCFITEYSDVWDETPRPGTSEWYEKLTEDCKKWGYNK